MSEIIIPAFKNETELKNFLNNNPIYLYNPDKIGKLSNEISKLENRLTFSNEYFSQIEPIWGLEKQFSVIDEANLKPEQREKSKMLILYESINNNYELMSEIVKDNLAAKNLTLICKHTGKDPIEFIKEQKKLGLPNYAISGVLNFDPSILLSKEPIKSISNYNGLLEPFKEILQANLVQYAFNVCTKSIQGNNGIDNIPPEAFNNPNFIEIIYSGNPSYLTISPQLGKLSIEDINNIIQLRKNFCENYSEIKKDTRLNQKEVGADQIFEVMSDNLKALSENLSNKIHPDNYQNFILTQSEAMLSNTNSFYNNLIQQNPQLTAIFAISDFEKYPPREITKDFANELINILKKYPQYYKQFFEIVSRYSTNNDFFEAILNNDFIKNNYPNLEKDILNDKLNFIQEITKEKLQTINPKVATVISKNDKPEVIKALVSLGDLIDSLNSEVINLIRKDPTKYATVVKNIIEAKSIKDITPETINFLANLQEDKEAQIFLSRFDLFKPIIEKMYDEKIDTQLINNVIDFITYNFKKAIPEKLSDETIYSNNALKDSFLYLLQKINIQNNSMVNSFLQNLSKYPQTTKMLEDAKFIINEHNNPIPTEAKNSKRFSTNKIKIYPEDVNENTNLEDINFNEENSLENFLNENPMYFCNMDNYLELYNHLNSIDESKKLSQKLNSIISQFFYVPDSISNSNMHSSNSLSSKIQLLANFFQKNIDNPHSKIIKNNSLSLPFSSKMQSLNNFVQKNLNNPDFKKITKTSTAMKNLWLICEKKGMTFEEFINNQKEKFKQNGHPELTNDEIFAILNFDPVNYFSNVPLKNFINPINIIKTIDEENETKISKNEINESEANKIKEAIKNENNVTHIDFSDLDDYLKERAETIMTLNAFNVYTLPQNNFVPQNTFYNNPNLTPHIFMTNLQPFNYIVNNSKIFDYMNLIQADLLNNYENIMKENMLIGELGPTDLTNAIKKYLEYDENNLSKFKEKLEKMGFNTEDINKITENDAQQLFMQTAKLFTNIRTANESIKSSPELYATFMLSKPEKYLLTNTSEMEQKQLANELTDILLKNPGKINKLAKLLSYYSKSDLFVELILENKDIKEKFPNLEKKIIQNKKEIIPQDLQNDIPPDNMLIYLNQKNFTKEKFNTFKSFGESFNSLTPFQIKALLSNSEMTKKEFEKIGLNYDNIAEYIKNINKAKTFDEFNNEVKILLSTDYKFFINLFDIRFDLCKPMLDYLISSQKINSATILLDTFVENLTKLNQKQITELYNGNKENFHYFLAKLNELEPNKLSDLQKFEQVRIWNYSNKITEIFSSDKNIEEKKSELKQFIDEIFDKELKNTESRQKAIKLLSRIINNLKNLCNENNVDSINLAISYIEKKSLIENTLDNIIAIYKTSTSHNDKFKQLTNLIESTCEFLDSEDLKELSNKLDVKASKTPDEKFKNAKKIISNKTNQLENTRKNKIIPEEKSKTGSIFRFSKKTKVSNEPAQK